MKPSWFYAACLTLLTVVFADTEILNFRLPLAPLDVEPEPTLSIRPGVPLLLNISLPDDQAVALDLRDHSAWTIRMSWAGSSPTKFKLSLGSLGSDHDTGVLRIQASHLSPTFYRVKSSFTPVHITLEPLFLGSIPHSILPTIGFLCLFAAVAGVLVRPVMALLEAQTTKEKVQ